MMQKLMMFTPLLLLDLILLLPLLFVLFLLGLSVLARIQRQALRWLARREKQ